MDGRMHAWNDSNWRILFPFSKTGSKIFAGKLETEGYVSVQRLNKHRGFLLMENLAEKKRQFPPTMGPCLGGFWSPYSKTWL